jgi:hypothetical protein
VRRKRTIYLDTQTKKRILEMLAVRNYLLGHRNANLIRLASLFYGITIGVGYVLVVGIMKTNGFALAPVLLLVAVASWLVARRLSVVETRKPVKIKI